MGNLQTTYLGLKLKNPLVAASSGLTGNIGKLKELENAGIGAVVLKSIFEEQILGEVSNMIGRDPQNSDYPEAEDYIKYYLRDNSVRNHIELIKAAKKELTIPVIASINCISDREWTSISREFEEAGADALELNVFYLPNSRNEDPMKLEQMYIDNLQKIVREVSIPVSVKIGYYHSNIIAKTDRLKSAGAKGVVMFNRFYEPDINLETLEFSAAEVFSSPSEFQRTLRWTGLVSSGVTQINLAASTGIHDSNAVIKLLLAGAQVTQLCSTLYINGFDVIPKILNELSAFMKKWNFKNIDDFRGRLSYKNIPDPMVYERSQFMKYFSNKS